jgi:hypothetical protein
MTEQRDDTRIKTLKQYAELPWPRLLLLYVAASTDSRVTLVSQAISDVRVMKMNGWES